MTGFILKEYLSVTGEPLWWLPAIFKTSVENLKAGKNFSIPEFNDAGPNHIYDCGMTYLNALKEVNRHWNDLYKSAG